MKKRKLKPRDAHKLRAWIVLKFHKYRNQPDILDEIYSTLSNLDKKLLHQVKLTATGLHPELDKDIQLAKWIIGRYV